MSEYFIVLALVFVPTLLLSFHPQSYSKGYLRVMWLSIIITAVPFVIWDIWAYNRGHWGFNYEYLFGPSILGLPLEEIAFFLFVPFSSLYVWIVIREYRSFGELIKRTLNK